MVREDIVGGLKVAMQKGYSLEQAMMSFYNAGYSKDAIEEAARFLTSPRSNSPYPQSPVASPSQPPVQNMPLQQQQKPKEDVQPTSPQLPSPQAQPTQNNQSNPALPNPSQVNSQNNPALPSPTATQSPPTQNQPEDAPALPSPPGAPQQNTSYSSQVQTPPQKPVFNLPKPLDPPKQYMADSSQKVSQYTPHEIPRKRSKAPMIILLTFLLLLLIGGLIAAFVFKDALIGMLP